MACQCLEHLCWKLDAKFGKIFHSVELTYEKKLGNSKKMALKYICITFYGRWSKNADLEGKREENSERKNSNYPLLVNFLNDSGKPTMLFKSETLSISNGLTKNLFLVSKEQKNQEKLKSQQVLNYKASKTPSFDKCFKLQTNFLQFILSYRFIMDLWLKVELAGKRAKP